MRKGSWDKRDDLKSQFYRSFWRANLISCGWVARDDSKSQFYRSFWRWNLISCERVRGTRGTTPNRNFTAVFGDRTSFRAEGLHGTTCKSQFYRSLWRLNLISCERVARDDLKLQFYRIFGDRTSFRAKWLRFVPSRWHCPAPSREK